MKSHLYVYCAAVLLLVGCGEKSSQTSSSTNTTSSADSVVTAPVGYLQAVAKDQQSAVKTIDTTSIDKAIQLFNVDKGRNPKDLNELVQEKYLSQIPAAPYGTKLVYDAQAGRVMVEKQ
jgi:hypothetical protein